MFARSELKQLLRVCGMQATSQGTSGVAEVLRMMLCKRGDLGRGNGGVAEAVSVGMFNGLANSLGKGIMHGDSIGCLEGLFLESGSRPRWSNGAVACRVSFVA
jgi:hypothetical protein